MPSPEAFVEATWTASPRRSLPAAFNPSTPPASRIPPSPLSHTGKKRKRKGEQDDLNGKIAELQERRQALLSPEGQDKYYRFGQMMEELARTAVAEKQHSAMVKAMSFSAFCPGCRRLVRSLNGSWTFALLLHCYSLFVFSLILHIVSLILHIVCFTYFAHYLFTYFAPFLSFIPHNFTYLYLNKTANKY